MSDSDTDVEVDFAKQANGETWALLEKESRTPDEDTAMLTAAYTSLSTSTWSGCNDHLPSKPSTLVRWQ